MRFLHGTWVESDAVVDSVAYWVKAKLIFITWGDSELAANLCQCAWGENEVATYIAWHVV